MTNLQRPPAELARPPQQAQADFMAMVFHDLRTPLASIKEALSLLSDTAACRMEERQRRYLTIAREEIDRLNRMIDDIVDISRLDSGKSAPRFGAVDLTELLATAIESLSPLISKRNLTVERSIPSHLPPVSGDRDRLLRVFDNLLDNAIKYTPWGGKIRVDMGIVEPGATAPTEGEVPADTGQIQVAVSDNGPGIPTDALDRIFDKFERVDQLGPGTGLGLAIVRSIVEMHHGKVWAESGPGKGASFRFTLPAKGNS